MSPTALDPVFADGREVSAKARVPYQPREVTRDAEGLPWIDFAEESVFWAALHAEAWRRDGTNYHVEQWRAHVTTAALELSLVDGPRSVRTRARRLERRLKRLWDVPARSRPARVGPRRQR
jgi:hypothetical protein